MYNVCRLISRCRSSVDRWGQQIISLARALWWSQCTTWFLFPLLQWQFDLFKFNYASISPIVDRWSSRSSSLNPCVGSWQRRTTIHSLSLVSSLCHSPRHRLRLEVMIVSRDLVAITISRSVPVFSDRFQKPLIWLSTFVDMTDRQRDRERERERMLIVKSRQMMIDANTFFSLSFYRFFCFPSFI